MTRRPVTLTYKTLDKKLFYKFTDVDNAMEKEIPNWKNFNSTSNQILPVTTWQRGTINAELRGTEKLEENKKGKMVSKFKIAEIIIGRQTYGLEQVEKERNVISYSSKAPYNFIPINDAILPFNETLGVTYDKYHLGLLSGYITLDIKTMTPTFIRGMGNKNLLINEKPILPGASLRGMIRNLAEVCCKVL